MAVAGTFGFKTRHHQLPSRVPVFLLSGDAGNNRAKFVWERIQFGDFFSITSPTCAPRPHLVDEKHWTVYPRFRLHCLTGDVPAGPAPIFNLRLSKDGGQTYGNYLPMSAGVAGAFEAIVDWYIRVRARDLVIEWSTMEAVDIVLVEGYLQGLYAGTG